MFEFITNFFKRKHVEYFDSKLYQVIDGKLKVLDDDKWIDAKYSQIREGDRII